MCEILINFKSQRNLAKLLFQIRIFTLNKYDEIVNLYIKIFMPKIFDNIFRVFKILWYLLENFDKPNMLYHS